jgi:DNA-directed RNA polymerase subunit RPC12/RpoP
VFKRCLVCETPFPPNEILERFPTGERVAFDPARGRLWAVCRACRRWSLAPIEERWEAIEELDRLVTDRGRLLSQSDNIALLKAGPLEVVRVGRAQLTEEAWWRYGRELTSRRDTYRKLSAAGALGMAGVIGAGMITGGMGLIGGWWLFGNGGRAVAKGARWLRFGGAAWRGSGSCASCGYEFRQVRYRERHGLYLMPGSDENAADVVYRCPECGHHREGGLHLRGREGERVLRRVLAYNHFKGASEREVRSATRLIEEAGSAQKLARIVIRDGRRLGDLQRTGALGLEIAANEHAEQRLLELELSELEAAWAEEEELAAIVDGELTPLPVLEQMRLKLTGRA